MKRKKQEVLVSFQSRRSHTIDDGILSRIQIQEDIDNGDDDQSQH